MLTELKSVKVDLVLFMRHASESGTAKADAAFGAAAKNILAHGGAVEFGTYDLDKNSTYQLAVEAEPIIRIWKAGLVNQGSETALHTNLDHTFIDWHVKPAELRNPQFSESIVAWVVDNST